MKFTFVAARSEKKGEAANHSRPDDYSATHGRHSLLGEPRRLALVEVHVREQSRDVHFLERLRITHLSRSHLHLHASEQSTDRKGFRHALALHALQLHHHLVPRREGPHGAQKADGRRQHARVEQRREGVRRALRGREEEEGADRLLLDANV